MSIWFKDYTTDKHGSMEMTGLNKQIGIKITQIGDDYLKGSMPVDDRTKQPAGLLHGGANCVLAETLASVGAYLVIDPSINKRLGMDDLHLEDYSIWEGWEVSGWPTSTILRGKVMVENGNLLGSPTDGRFQKRVIASQVINSPAC